MFEPVYAVIGVVNLFIISGIFSMLMISGENIWASCGLHSVWNFVIYSILGLTLSGGESAAQGVIRLNVEKANVWYGGEYGIEAGLTATVVLGVTLGIMIICYIRKKKENGIQ